MSADPEVPPTTTPATPPAASAGSGLPKNTAAGLAALFPLVGGIVFFMLDRKDPYVRFYSVQSIGFGILIVAAEIVLGILATILGFLHLGPLVGLLGMLFSLAVFVVVIVATINAFRGKEWQIPFIWPLIQKYESKFPQ